MLDEGPSQGLLLFLAAAAGTSGTLTAASLAGPLAVVVICLFLSALFSGAEAGFLALSRLQVLELAEQKHPRAKLLLRIIEKPAELVSSLLIANTTVNVLMAIMWGILVEMLLSSWQGSASMEYVQLFLQVVVLTLIVVVLAEVTPKAWAHNFPLQFCTAVAPMIAPVMAISRPAVAVFQTAANFILRLFGIRRADGPGFTEEELIQYLAASEESGVLEEEEREMIHSIFQFGDLDVQQVMVPRVEMVTVDESATLADAMRAAMESGHSRLPVHSGDRDHIVGIIHAKDLIRQLADGDQSSERTVKDSDQMRPVQFIHGTMPISRLFGEMKAHKYHIAIVVDEYGGTDGLVTIEDLLEELVGDIIDESDVEEPLYYFDKVGDLVVDGHLPLHELAELIDWAPEQNGVDTVGGLIYSALGRVPAEGEEVDLGGLIARVLTVDENRIKELKLVGAPLTTAAREELIQHNPEAEALLPRPTDEGDSEEDSQL